MRKMKEQSKYRKYNSKTFHTDKKGERVLRAHGGHIHYFNKLGVGDGQIRMREVDWSLSWNETKRGWFFEYHSFQPFLPEYADEWVEFRDVFEGKDQTVKYRAKVGHVKGRLVQGDELKNEGLDRYTSVNAVIYDDAFGQGIDYILYFTRSRLVKAVRIRDEHKANIKEDVSFEFDVEFPNKQVKRGYDQDKVSYVLDKSRAKRFDTDKSIMIGSKPANGKEGHTYLLGFKVWDSDRQQETISVDLKPNQDGTFTLTKHIPKSFIDKAVGDVYTDTTTSYYSHSSDGNIWGGNATYNTIHDATSATVSNTATEMTVSCWEQSGTFYIDRIFMSFDTSGLPSVPGISSAVLNLYCNVDSIDGSIALVEGQQASDTSLTGTDFDNCGDAVDNPTEGSDSRLNPTVSTAETITLNKTGEGWISTSGYTKLGLRADHDADDTGSVSNETYVRFRTSEQTGTSEDPYLEITYTENYVFHDTFTESSNTTLASHVPDVGDSWTVLESFNGTHSLSVTASTDTLNIGVGGLSDGVLYTADATYPTADYEITLTATTPDSSDDYNAIIGRATDSENFYIVEFNEDLLRLAKKVSGSFTNLATDNAGAPVAGETVKLKMVGTTISVEVNGVEEISVTDSALTAAGKAGYGVGSFRNADGDMSAQEIDNFLVVNLGSLGTETSDTRNAKVTGSLDSNDTRNAKVTGQDTTNDTRNAKVTGQSSTNDTRNAKTTGVDTTNDTRPAKVTGSLSTSSTRPAKVTGQITASDTRSAKVTGQDTTSDTRNAKTTGSLSASDTRNAKVTGQDSVSDTRSAKVSGTADTNDTRPAKVTGSLSASDTRNAKITGQDTSNDTRNAKVTGSLDSNDTRNAKTTGVDTTSDTRPAKVTGQDTTNSDRPAKVTGQDSTSDTRPAKTTGILGANDTRPSKVTGQDSTSDTRPAKVIGQDSVSDTRNAKVTGQDTTSSTRPAKVTGQTTTNDTRNAKITGSIDVSDTRNAKVSGVDTTSDTRPAKVTGQDSSSSERSAKVTGQAGTTTNDTRPAKITGQTSTNDTRNAKVIGQDSTSDTRNAKVTGKDATNSERGAKTTGGVASERSAKITGQTTPITSRTTWDDQDPAVADWTTNDIGAADWAESDKGVADWVTQDTGVADWTTEDTGRADWSLPDAEDIEYEGS